ncbi:hypothetical protein [Kribbella sp. NPDC055071]
MTRLRRTAGLAGIAVLAATLVPGVGSAQASASAACSVTLGAVTAAGDHQWQAVRATSPVSVSQTVVEPTGLFPAGNVGLATGLGYEQDPPAAWVYRGYVTIATDLYAFNYAIDDSTGQLDPGSYTQRKVGGGWTSDYTYLEESRVWQRTTTYALRGDVITRWTVEQGAWRNKTTYGGFSAVKTMTLISQTATYDSFLATTRGGALYTIRIPLSGSPVVKKVRASTWQSFEALVAVRCGNQSTLLLGIDKDTHSGYLYAVGHANGTSTVIKGLGKAPTSFTDKTYFRYYGADSDVPRLYGE